MLNVKITGLEALQRNLEEASKAMASLHGTITTLKFNPADPESVNGAIREMEAAVDQKIAPYASNSIVAELAAASKTSFRNQILKMASTRNEQSPQI
jgi:hypothetical protein